MQLSIHSGSHALEAAFARISRLPLPIVGVVQASAGDDYTDNYHDAYNDDPYVDMPYDDEYSDSSED